jgi:putative chitinase
MLVLRDILDHVAGRNTGALGDDIANGMDRYCPQYEITTHLRLAHFIAQACHETGGFRYLQEIWGPTDAQKRYEYRKDLGNTKLGDGHMFRGRGIFQLTGRANYERVGKSLGLPLIVDPDLAADPQVSVRIAGHYWSTHQINVPADANDIVRVTRAINGGLNGLGDRKACFIRARQMLP